MTNLQLYLAMGVPIAVNLTAIGLLYTFLTARIDALERSVDHRFDAVTQRFDTFERAIDQRFTAIDQRFQDLSFGLTQGLLRVEGVLDARLKAVEDHRR